MDLGVGLPERNLEAQIESQALGAEGIVKVSV